MIGTRTQLRRMEGRTNCGRCEQVDGVEIDVEQCASGGHGSPTVGVQDCEDGRTGHGCCMCGVRHSKMNGGLGVCVRVRVRVHMRQSFGVRACMERARWATSEREAAGRAVRHLDRAGRATCSFHGRRRSSDGRTQERWANVGSTRKWSSSREDWPPCVVMASERSRRQSPRAVMGSAVEFVLSSSAVSSALVRPPTSTNRARVISVL